MNLRQTLRNFAVLLKPYFKQNTIQLRLEMLKHLDDLILLLALLKIINSNQVANIPIINKLNKHEHLLYKLKLKLVSCHAEYITLIGGEEFFGELLPDENYLQFDIP